MHHPEVSLSISSSRLDPAGLLWALLAAVFGSTVAVAGKWLLGAGAGPLTVVALRATIAVAVLGLALLLFHRSAFRLPWREVPFFALYGLVGVALLYLTFILAVQEIGAALSTTLFYVYPTIATLLAALFLKERLTWRKVLPLPLAFLGCFLVSGLWPGGQVAWRPAGVLWALLSGTIFALYFLLGRRALARHSPWTALFYSLVWGAFFLDLLWAVLSLFPSAQPLLGAVPAWNEISFWGALAYLALGATLGMYLADLQALRRIEVRQLGLVGTLEPLISALLAFVLFAERLTPWQWAGAAAIVSGVLWLRWER
jgi:DME family drug/metabolite transporter